MAELIYVADPMCSWCYGFTPELTQVRAEIDLPMRLIMGGLWPRRRAQPLNEDLRRYLRGAWSNVAALSGQPFAFELLEWTDWVYDTEPACRAVATMRTMSPGDEHRFLSVLQYAFYAENRDLTDDFVYPDLLESFPVATDEFMSTMRSRDLEERTDADFTEARELGAAGFPTLLLRDGQSVVPLTRGFKRAQDVVRTYRILAP